MAKSQNKNSVKSTKLDMLAARGNENKNATRVAFTAQDKYVNEQIINARKSSNLDNAKEKAKKKAKMAKASRKKNKK